MRTVLAVTIALALCGPGAALAARVNAATDLSQMVSAYERVQAVRVIERFENGAVATVDVLPSGQYRIASTGGQDPVLIVKLATQPIPDVSVMPSSYTVKELGTKTIAGVKETGYTIAALDGSYTATVWTNPDYLPVDAEIRTQGHDVSLEFGNYNDSELIGAR